MKLLFDLFPVILFFVSYRFANEAVALIHWLTGVQLVFDTPDRTPIFLATVVTMAASVAQILWLKLRGRKVETMLWFSAVLVGGLGSATLYFHNPAFIKWKPTLLYWSFALALGLGPLLFKRNFIRLLMQEQVTLPDLVWARLNLAWAVFFLIMGGVNLLVAHEFSESTWVNFKLFGTLGATLAFALAQGLYIARFLPEDASHPTDRASS